MIKKIDFVWIVIMIAALIAAGSGVAQKTTPQKPPDKFTLGEDEVKQLVLLMDADKNGKISKQEYMKFMEVEFDRLDVNKNGELDVNELRQSRIRASRGAVGK